MLPSCQYTIVGSRNPGVGLRTTYGSAYDRESGSTRVVSNHRCGGVGGAYGGLQ
jgi:hypothetical protein